MNTSNSSGSRTIAAIDIGTNSAHLVVAQMDHVGEMRVLDTDKTVLRLGEAFDEEGRLSQDAIERTVQTIRHMKKISAAFSPLHRVVATHATREARNHQELLKAVAAATDLQVELIDGIEEARLAFLGMRYGLALSGQQCLGVDIGGGSTEMIVARDDDIEYVTSAKLGAVTLAKRFFGKDYSAANLHRMKEFIRGQLAPMESDVMKLSFEQAIASSGTAKALAYIHARLILGKELNDANGHKIERDDLFQITSQLENWLTPNEIKINTKIDAGRAEVIVSGALVLAQITRLFRVEEWTITTYGLREGLVADTFYRQCGIPKAELPNVQWQSVIQFSKRLGIKNSHAEHVMGLSLELYDQLADHYIDGEPDRRNLRTLLMAAAYLREAGRFIGTPQYHKHSAYLLRHTRLPGFTEAERHFMGLIAQFQRKGLPSAGNRHCVQLDLEAVNQLKLAAACVRIAAALDRSRHNRVVKLRTLLTNTDIDIEVYFLPNDFPDVEIYKANLERTSLQKLLSRTIRFLPRSLAPQSKGTRSKVQVDDVKN